MTSQLIVGYSAGRDRKDFYETPAVAVEKLCAVERFEGGILDPCCGAGALVRALQEQGYPLAYGTDLHDYGFGMRGLDYLSEAYPCNEPNIVMNPPFSLAEAFVRKARVHSEKVVVLQRLQWLEGQRRRALFQECGLTRVWVFSKRLPMMHREGYEGPKSSSALAFAWYVFMGPPARQAVLGWL